MDYKQLPSAVMSGLPAIPFMTNSVSLRGHLRRGRWIAWPTSFSP